MRIAVAGGTGLVGSKVTERLVVQGHEVVTLTRGSGVDLTTGVGLVEALAGVESIVDVTSLRSTKPAETVAFFQAVATHLQTAGAAAGVRRIVTLSIVGIDGLGGGAYGHYDGKQAQEAATEAGSVPTAILRATQFHGFAGQVIDWVAKAGVLPCPITPVQTVDVDTVADELVTLAVEVPAGQHARREIAGPEKGRLADQARRIAQARGRRLWVVPVWLPGSTPKRVRAGALQAGPDTVVVGGTFADWLAREYPGR